MTKKREPSESHEDWAQRIIANGPPPPQRVVNRVARMRANYERSRPLR